MKCKNCGATINKGDEFCDNCGMRINQARSNKQSKIYIAIIIVLILIILALILSFTFITLNNKNKEDNLPSETQLQEETTTEEKSTEKEEIFSETFPAGTTSSTEENQKEHEIFADKLFRPADNLFCDQYKMYVSGAQEGQDYVKMRFGPSKTRYNVVGQIDNGGRVTVQTKSVDGWTLIYYEEKEGWVRTDFLKESYAECVPEGWVNPDFSARAMAYVDVTGEYDGEPLNMRRGPDKSYPLITTVPDETCITVLGYSSTIDTWVYILYDGYTGWVLSKYVSEYAGTGDKPVLYLYPEEKTDINVKIDSKNMFLSCSYPEYNNGWDVTAFPDGKIINKADSKEYSYLYYELAGKENYDFSKGFVVKGSETAAFLQETLSEMGLFPKEYNEFIVYWLPKMQNNPYNFITFQQEAYTDEVKLDITPEPDSMLRVFMAYKPLTEYIEAEPQEIHSFERKGFCVVEWGGVEVQ